MERGLHSDHNDLPGKRIATHDPPEAPAAARASQIVAFDGGRIADRGTHAPLMAREGVYAAFWARQPELAGADQPV